LVWIGASWADGWML